MQVVLTQDLSQPLSKAIAMWLSLGQEGSRPSELSLVGQGNGPRVVSGSLRDVGCIRDWRRSSKGLKGVKDPPPV